MSICLNIHLCTTYMPGTQRNRRGSQIPLDLELRMVVNHRVGARNRTQVICKSKNTQWLSQLASWALPVLTRQSPGWLPWLFCLPTTEATGNVFSEVTTHGCFSWTGESFGFDLVYFKD